MKIIVGLGNPGKEYEQTRHNAGFMLLDRVRADWNGANWQEQKKFQAEISKNSGLILLKPQTFMNLSGNAVAAILKFYNLNAADDLIVAFDDLDLEVGTWKMQKGRGPHGHNGLESIYRNLGTKDFWHIRIGIDGRAGDRKVASPDYVLGKFRPEEKKALEQDLDEIEVELKKLI